MNSGIFGTACARAARRGVMLGLALGWAASLASAALVTPPVIDWVTVPATGTLGQPVSVGVGAHAELSDNSDGNEWNGGFSAQILRVTVDWRRPDGSVQRIHDWLPNWSSPAEIWTSFTPTTPGTHYVDVQLMDGRPWYSSVQSYAISVPNPVPTITSPLEQIAVRGTTWNYQITTSGTATSFSVTGLPPGASSVSASGLITLTPTTVGSFSATISATNAVGTDTKTLRIHVADISPLTVSLAGGAALASPPTIAFGQTVTVTATANDPSRTLTQTQFMGDFGQAGTWSGYAASTTFSATDNRTFTMNYQPTARGSGRHRIAATGRSAPGGVAQTWSREVELVVDRAVPTITWNPASSPVTIGQTFGALRLNATAANPHTTAVAFAPTTAPTYRVTAGPALVGQTITASTAVNATGTYTVEAAWAQTANFAAASTTRTITVDAGIVPNGSVTPGAANIGDRVSIYRDGTTTLPYAWTETTIWRPDGTAAASFIDFTAQGVRQIQVTQAGTWYYQMRLVDSAYNFRDQWIPFTVDLPRQNLPYTTSFEQSQGFIVNGNLFPQQGWIVQQGAADVSAEQARTGTHGVKLIAGPQRAQVLKAFNASGSRTFLDLYLRPVAAAAVGDSSVFYFGASRLGFTLFDAGTGALQMFRGDGQGGGAWVDTGYRFPLNASAQATQWMRVTIEHDYTARVWQLIVDGVRVRSDIPLRSNAETTFTDLTWTGTTTAAAYVDDFAATTTNPLLPPAPQGLTASELSFVTLRLSWTAPSFPASPPAEYQVQRAGGPTLTSTSPTLAVSGLRPGTTYSFTVRTRNQAGYWSAWSTAVSAATLVDTVAPTAPAGVQVRSVTASSVELTWQPATDNSGVISGYRVLRGGVEVGFTDTTSFTDTGVLDESTYRYTVRAVDAADNLSVPSASVDATTLALDPAGDADGDGVSNGEEKFLRSLGFNVHWRTPGDVRPFNFNYDKSGRLTSGPGGGYESDAEGSVKKVKP